ncbi:MAG TPA: ribosome-associated translation inhibitor RaiA [Streptosporangiaceae bacterium]
MDIIFKGRHTDVQERFRERATVKLSKIGKLDSKAIRVDVEVSAEHNPRQADRRERVELTITSRGPAIRAEAAGQDRFAALDMALAKLESRLRRVGDRRKARRGTAPVSRPGEGLAPGVPGQAEASGEEAAQSGPRPGARVQPAAPSVPQARPGSPDGAGRAPGASSAQTGVAVTAADDVVPIEMEGDGPLVVREKFHLAQPMPIDQALFEMELVGHDFFLFRDCEDGCPSVVYRRRGYQYGVIRLVEEPPAGRAAGSAADPLTAAADGHAAHRAGRGAARRTDVAAG